MQRVLAEGRSRRQAAEAFGLSVRTVQKWLRRYREEGAEGLRDRSSRPHLVPGQTAAEQEIVVLELRRQYRLSALHLARAVRLSRSTVGRPAPAPRPRHRLGVCPRGGR